MKAFIQKYHLDIGLLLSVVLPFIFVFQETEPQRMLIRFISSGLFIFSLWTVNFLLVDFKGRELKNRNVFWYGKVVLAFVLTTSFYIIIGFKVDNTETMLSQVRGEKFFSLKSWFYLTIRLSLLNVLVLIIKYLFDSNEEKRKIEIENAVLKRENLAALHEVLKQQLKPHFLFNSLNTLKSLVRTNPELAEEFISELSAIYRYMIIHQTKEAVPLQEEVAFAKSYLFLLQIRFGEAISAEISIPEETQSTYIPPNTLQLLIENAVKHNSFSQSKPLKISLFINESFLVIENSMRSKELKSESSSLGLKNINSRYELLFNKNIIVQKTENAFKVSLPLNCHYAGNNH